MNGIPLRRVTACRSVLFGCGMAMLVWIGMAERSDERAVAVGRSGSAASAISAKGAAAMDPVKLIDSLPDALFTTDHVQYFLEESEATLAKQRLALEEYRSRHASPQAGL